MIILTFVMYLLLSRFSRSLVCLLGKPGSFGETLIRMKIKEPN